MSFQCNISHSFGNVTIDMKRLQIMTYTSTKKKLYYKTALYNIVILGSQTVTAFPNSQLLADTPAAGSKTSTLYHVTNR